MTNYFGKISDTSAVENLHPAFKAAFDFLKRDDIFSLPEGRYDIIGGGKCYAAIESPLLRLPNQAKCEAHKKYIDIHFPLSGPEYMGIGVTPEEIIQNGAAFDNDVAFFDVDGTIVDNHSKKDQLSDMELVPASTVEAIRLLKENGICEIHRKTYEPVVSYIKHDEQLTLDEYLKLMEETNND